MAVPRLAPFGGEGVALPQPLAAPDAAILRRLFARPRVLAAAFDHLAGALDGSVRLNDELLGHVLAERYLKPGYHATAVELSAWLDRHAALPDAAAIAALLHRRDPAAILPSIPQAMAGPPPIPEESAPAERTFTRNPLLDDTVRQRLHDGHIDSALRLIGQTRALAPHYGASLRAEVAQAMFTRNRDADALALAERAVRDGGGTIALADQVAGLAAWRLGRTALAGRHFAAAAQAAVATSAQRAAGAYWAARASFAAHDAQRGRSWLVCAAQQQRTFYGQIAARAIGRSAGLSFPHEVLGEADVDAVAAEPAGLRAFALLQLGQTDRAEAELRALGATLQNRPALLRAVVLVSVRAGLPDLGADLAAQVEQQGGQGLDADRFPVPRLRPRNGFLMDPALVYALTRIESNFDPHAHSAMGAQGLMQLMPRTAGAMAQRDRGAPHLHDPAVNLDLGQRYVAYLSQQDQVAGDLIRLLASYNSGPAAFARWSGDIRAHDDPLLFIEAMPTTETRAFVQRALAYTWIYAARLHLPTPSLDALATYRFPRFSTDGDRLELATLH